MGQHSLTITMTNVIYSYLPYKVVHDKLNYYIDSLLLNCATAIKRLTQFYRKNHKKYQSCDH